MADAVRGTVSRRDLIGASFSEPEVDHWIALGLLERVHRGEYRIPGSGWDRQQQLASRLWRAGPGARLAGPLACALRGLAGFTDADDDYVAIPPGRQVTGVDFAVVRTPIPEVDQDVIDGLPGVTVERGLIGAAALRSQARVRAALYDAKFKGLTDDERLGSRAVELGRAHGAPQMRRILGSGGGKVESFKEFDLLAVFRHAERPVPQVWVQWHGKWHRLDFVFLDARLALEYDGKNHEDQRDRDADRDLALMELNIQTIRVTKQMLADPAELRRRILAVRDQRLALNLRPIVPDAPPWL